MKKVLEKVENSIFNSTKKAYDVFKEFDQDRDGYVSHNDVIEKLEKANILEP